MFDYSFVRDLALILAVAGIFGIICMKLRLSLSFGYLLAGVLMGPSLDIIPLGARSENLLVFAQLGQIFLMFSIGMHLGLTRVRRVGLSLLVAVIFSSMIVFGSSSVLAGILGGGTLSRLFVTGIFISSSTVVVRRILISKGLLHTRAGQLALTLTLLEDFAAVVLLSILAPYLGPAGGDATSLPRSLGAFVTFAGFMIVMAVLLFPAMMRILRRPQQIELRNLLTSVLLLSMALLAHTADYAPALGAFILGMAAAGTAERRQIERAYAAMRDMFTALFFVTIGMLLDVQAFRQAWPYILLFSLTAIPIRVLAATTGLILAGSKLRHAVQAGLLVMPIGEFSFLAIQLGVSSGYLHPYYSGIVVGVALVSTLQISLLAAHTEKMALALERKQPAWLRRGLDLYREVLLRMGEKGQDSSLMKLAGRHYLHLIVELVAVSGFLLFAHPFWDWLGALPLRPWLLELLYWITFAVLVLGPLIASWLNIDSLAMLHAGYAAARFTRSRELAAVLYQLFRVLGLIGLGIWLWALVPFAPSGWAAAVASVFILLLLVALFWKKYIRWHSLAEQELHRGLTEAAENETGPQQLTDRLIGVDWEIHVEDVELPPMARCRGMRLDEINLRKQYGCSIVLIERQGVVIDAPSAQERVYPEDRLLLSGAKEQIARARAHLMDSSRKAEGALSIDQVQLEAVTLHTGSRAIGNTIQELNIAPCTGCQILSLARPGVAETLRAEGSTRLQEHDQLLALGTANQLQALRRLLLSDDSTSRQAVPPPPARRKQATQPSSAAHT